MNTDFNKVYFIHTNSLNDHPRCFGYIETMNPINLKQIIPSFAMLKINTNIFQARIVFFHVQPFFLCSYSFMGLVSVWKSCDLLYIQKTMLWSSEACCKIECSIKLLKPESRKWGRSHRRLWWGACSNGGAVSALSCWWAHSSKIKNNSTARWFWECFFEVTLNTYSNWASSASSFWDLYKIWQTFHFFYFQGELLCKNVDSERQV